MITTGLVSYGKGIWMATISITGELSDEQAYIAELGVESTEHPTTEKILAKGTQVPLSIAKTFIKDSGIVLSKEFYKSPKTQEELIKDIFTKIVNANDKEEAIKKSYRHIRY